VFEFSARTIQNLECVCVCVCTRAHTCNAAVDGISPYRTPKHTHVHTHTHTHTYLQRCCGWNKVHIALTLTHTRARTHTHLQRCSGWNKFHIVYHTHAYRHALTHTHTLTLAHTHTPAALQWMRGMHMRNVHGIVLACLYPTAALGFAIPPLPSFLPRPALRRLSSNVCGRPLSRARITAAMTRDEIPSFATGVTIGQGKQAARSLQDYGAAVIFVPQAQVGNEATYLNIRMYLYVKFTYICTHIYINARSHTDTHARTHTHTHARMHARTHARAHMYARPYDTATQVQLRFCSHRPI